MLSILIEEYIESLRGSVSRSTIRSYVSDINTLKEFIYDNNIKLEKFNIQKAEKYKDYLMNHKNYKNTTSIRKLQVAEYFFSYLLEMQYLNKNPFLKIKHPKRNNKLPKHLSIKEVKQLIKIIESQSKNSNQNIRNRLIVELAIYQGLRVEEIVNIEINNIDLEERTLLINGKGSKERILVLTKQVVKSIKEYMIIREETSNKYLITSSRGQLSKRMAQKVVKEGLIEMGLDDYSIHDLRHTSATLMLDNGIDIRGVQAILGHSNINTTTIYAYVTKENKAKITKRMESIF